jgi:DNA-binding GntR family transcriptional regulator
MSKSRAATGTQGLRRNRTLAEELRIQIADEIVQGKIDPGTALDEHMLARRFGVSRTPVREAIRELAASGLVDAEPHRAAVVARPTAERLKQMFDVMAELEALCAGMSAVHMTLAERRELQDLHASLGELVRRGDPATYNETNEAFHAFIYAGSHNEYLAELTLATRKRVSPFRRAQFRSLGRLALSYQEHDHVVTAILRGDREGAATHMRAHILTVENAYERYAETV